MADKVPHSGLARSASRCRAPEVPFVGVLCHPVVCYNNGMFYEVIPEGKMEALTYDYDDSLLVGQIVMVPVGRRNVAGIVVKKVAQPGFKTKKILKVLYSKPLPKHLVATVGFMHDYYKVASGQAVSMILPKGVEKQRRKSKTEQMFGNQPISSDKMPHSGSRPTGPSPRAVGAQPRAAALRKSPPLGHSCRITVADEPDIPLS